MGVLRKLFCLFTLAFLAGCVAVAPPKEVESPELGLVFGHIQAPERVTEIVLRQYGKIYIRPFRQPPRVLIYRNGNFMAENLKPGKYILSSVATPGHRYNLVKQKIDAYQKIITVHPGTVNYIGSYRIYEKDPGEKSRSDNFKMMRTRKPDERWILKHLYELSEGTGWQVLFRKRLMELR